MKATIGGGAWKEKRVFDESHPPRLEPDSTTALYTETEGYLGTVVARASLRRSKFPDCSVLLAETLAVRPSLKRQTSE